MLQAGLLFHFFLRRCLFSPTGRPEVGATILLLKKGKTDYEIFL